MYKLKQCEGKQAIIIVHNSQKSHHVELPSRKRIFCLKSLVTIKHVPRNWLTA